MSIDEEFNKRSSDVNRWYSKSNIKKWGITGLLVPFIPFALTQLDKYFEERSYQQVNKALVELTPTILINIREEVSEGIALYESNNAKVSNETKVAVYAKIVLVQSIDKVAFIVSELDACNRRTSCKEISDFSKRQLMRRVSNELFRQSDIYITLLNNLKEHPRLGKIGDFVATTFPMTGDTSFMQGNFMRDLEEIIFMEGITPHDKGDAIMNYMKEIQLEYFKLVLVRMNSTG